MTTKFLQIILLLTIGYCPVTAQICYAPEKPQAGQPVSFTYTPQGKALTTDSTIEGRFVRYGAPNTMRVSQPTTVTLVRQGTDFVGQVVMPKSGTSGIALLFRSGQFPQRTDHNGGHLYVLPAYDVNGQLLPHALGGQASVFTRTHFLYEVGSRPDPKQVVALYEAELSRNPDLRPLYWSDYYAALIKQRKPGYGPKVKAGIESYLRSRPDPTTAELTAGAQLYESMGDFKMAGALRERQKSLDPAGSLMQKDLAMAVRVQTDWNRQKALYTAFVREFPNSAYAPGLTVMMTDGYFKNGDIPGLVRFVNEQPEAQTDVLMLNTMAFQMADDRRSLPEAEQLIRRALTLLKSQPKPASVTAANWPVEKQNRQRQLMNTLAHTLEQQGKYADAYAAYGEVMLPDDVDNSDPRTNERYYLCALQTNHGADARPLAEAAVQANKATRRLKTALRDWYAKQPGQNVAKADSYLTSLEADLRAEQRDELRERLINEPAPAFSLTDLQGRTISSSAFRGKVIVLDFWATWCVPCIASFPAMQQAQTHFQSDPNVRFLFVNTREGGPVGRVYDFMNKHPYPFVVPLDGQQRVAKAYKVQGIPTKVVIGPNGRVRYRYVGYNGNAEATVDELTLVVEMLKEGL